MTFQNLTNEFNLSNTTLKALDILKNNQHKLFFESSSLPNADVIKVFHIFLLIITVKDEDLTSCLQFSMIEVMEKIKEYYIASIPEIGAAISRDIKKAVMSTTKYYLITKLGLPFLDCFTPAFFNKKSSTCGIFVFPIKEVLEYYGIIIDKKFSAEASTRYIQECIERVKLRIKYSES